MKFNIYIIENGTRKLFKENIDGSMLRIFISNLTKAQKDCIEVECVKNKECITQEDMTIRNEEAWFK